MDSRGDRMSSMSTEERNVQTVARHAQFVERILTRVTNSTGIDRSEFLISIIYPIILIAGQLTYLLSPTEQVKNYFTSKRNIFNVYFVKNGWGWTIIAFGLLLFKRYKTHRTVSLLSIIRFAIATVCWILYTQWFFGPPLMDRIFLLTGGKCYNIPERSLKKLNLNQVEAFKPMDFIIEAIEPFKKQDNNYFYARHLSSQACRSLRGSWYGGHDPSGHVFLLTLSSTFLLLEIIHMGYSINDLKLQFKRFFANLKFDYENKRYFHLFVGNFVDHHLVSVSLLISLWLWMLLMTSIHFHSLTEKFFGLLWSYLSIVLTYIVPRYIKKRQSPKVA